MVLYDVYVEMKLNCTYSDYQKILPIISEWGFRVNTADYGEGVAVTGSILKKKSDDFSDALTQITSARAKIEILSENVGFDI